MKENAENICNQCAYHGQQNDKDSACDRCPVINYKHKKDDENSYFQRPQIIRDESYIEKNMKLLLFIERLAEVFKNKNTFDIFRIYLSDPNLSITFVSKQMKLSRQNVYHHLKKIKRCLPEIFMTIEHKPKRKKKM